MPIGRSWKVGSRGSPAVGMLADNDNRDIVAHTLDAWFEPCIYDEPVLVRTSEDLIMVWWPTGEPL